MKFDVIYGEHGATISPHFCRDWDESGGCYGTNPDHGYELNDACEIVAAWYEQEAVLWRGGLHHTVSYYQGELDEN